MEEKERAARRLVSRQSQLNSTDGRNNLDKRRARARSLSRRRRRRQSFPPSAAHPILCVHGTAARLPVAHVPLGGQRRRGRLAVDVAAAVPRGAAVPHVGVSASSASAVIIHSL